MDEDPPDVEYAVALADGSYTWYRNAAIRARRLYRGAETITLVTSASIPISAVVSPKNATVPAVLGAIIVVVSGLNSVFHWRDNYLRFSRAREAIEAERRRYYMHSDQYDNSTKRSATLVAAVSRIEQDEMNGWIQVASERPKR